MHDAIRSKIRLDFLMLKWILTKYCEGGSWNPVANATIQGRDIVNLWVPLKTGTFLTGWATISFWRTLLHGVTWLRAVMLLLRYRLLIRWERNIWSFSKLLNPLNSLTCFPIAYSYSFSLGLWTSFIRGTTCQKSRTFRRWNWKLGT